MTHSFFSLFYYSISSTFMPINRSVSSLSLSHTGCFILLAFLFLTTTRIVTPLSGIDAWFQHFHQLKFMYNVSPWTTETRLVNLGNLMFFALLHSSTFRNTHVAYVLSWHHSSQCFISPTYTEKAKTFCTDTKMSGKLVTIEWSFAQHWKTLQVHPTDIGIIFS